MDDLRAYLMYGTVKPTDAVWDEAAQIWLSLQDLLSPADSPRQDPPPAPKGWMNLLTRAAALLTATPQSKANTIPRRVVRYRDYHKVPPNQRAGRVLGHLIVGALFFPPWLWASCATLFSERLFRNTTDEQGYLRLLSSRFEILGALLLVLNTLAIAAGLWFFTTAIWPQIVSLLHSMLTAAQDLLGEVRRTD
jgi:hypothetical protein